MAASSFAAFDVGGPTRRRCRRDEQLVGASVSRRGRTFYPPRHRRVVHCPLVQAPGAVRSSHPTTEGNGSRIIAAGRPDRRSAPPPAHAAVVVNLRRPQRPPPDGDGTPDPLDAALVAALAGDEDAFRVLYRGVQPGLVRYLRHLVGADADDVASETWLQVCRDLPRFSGNLQGFRAWYAAIGRNRAIDHVRRRHRRPETVQDDGWLTDVPDPDDTAVLAFDAMATTEALALIAKLPHDQAEAVLLRVVAGLDAASAAKVLGKRPGAVRTAAHRGLRRLAEMMERRHV